MEATSASAHPATPQTYQTSHMRSSQYPKASPTSEATRSNDSNDTLHPTLSAPASQESFASLQSVGSSAAGLQLETSSSNASQLTSLSDLTSPAPEQRYVTPKPDITRVRTPEEATSDTQRSDNHVLASPMSVTTPFSTNGTKRTASGHVKNAPSLPNTPLTATFSNGRPRADSISSTNSTAGELAMNLKARLGYAMAKVQNGWENKDINEVEQLAAYKMSPHRRSMSHLDYSRRPLSAGLSNGTAGLSMYEADNRPPSKRHSGRYDSYAPPSSQPTLAPAPRLEPAPDIRPATSHRREHSQPTSSNNNVMSPPRTPVNGQGRRPPTIRTEMQTSAAERDALQALFQLGSPHASQMSHHRNSQPSSSQASPLRSEFATPRRVTFARSESDSSSSHPSVVSDGDRVPAEAPMQEV